jgi:hypothetical protein
MSGSLHEFMISLDKAGFTPEILQNVITSKGNKMAKTMYASITTKGMKQIVADRTAHLKLINSNVAVRAFEDTFNPTKHFCENKNIKYWLSDNFQKYVLNSAQPFSKAPAMSFSKYSLKADTTDKDIMEELGITDKLMTREEILQAIADLTSNQPKGESGTLLTNGYATIIGYMTCDDGAVRGVGVGWDADGREWGCGCGGLDGWGAGDEVLSRN